MLILTACSKIKSAADQEIPDLSRKGEWTSVYSEVFTQESLSDNWVPLRGPSFDNLHEIPGTFVGWDIEEGRLKGKTSEAIGLRLKGKFYGDLEFHIKFTHKLKHRNFIISLGDKNFDNAYCLSFLRNELMLTKYGINNTIYRKRFTDKEDNGPADIRFKKDGNRITIYLNESKIIDYVDLFPPISSDYNCFYIGCMESLLEIEGLEILSKRIQEENNIVKNLMYDFQNGSMMIFLDNYNRMYKSIPEEERRDMQIRVLQAAASVGNYDLLINAGKNFPGLPREFLAFMKYVGYVKQGDPDTVPSLEKEKWRASGDFRRNLYLVLFEQIAQAQENNNTEKKDKYYNILFELCKSDAELMNTVLIKQAIDLAENANKEECYKKLINLIEALSGADSDLMFPEAIRVWSDIARRFDDMKTFDILLGIADSKLRNAPGCRSWQYLNKGEWLISRGNKEEGLLWLNRVIDEFEEEAGPWLWANCSKAKVLVSQGRIKEWIPYLRDIINKYSYYQKQTVMLESIIRKSANPEERIRWEESIKAKTGIKSIRVSSEEEGLDGPYALVDGSLDTRWGSEHGIDFQWILIEFNQPREIKGLKLFWETAAAGEYDILVSQDGVLWKKAAIENNGKKGDIRLFLLNRKDVRYLKINLKKRATHWGYSLWEIVLI